MLELYNICKAKDKIWRVMPNGTHNATVGEPFYFNHVVDFLTQKVEGRADKPSLEIRIR